METLGAERRRIVRVGTLDVKPYHQACSSLFPSSAPLELREPLWMVWGSFSRQR